ncbi:MAG: T9SS type A sorting domain-containing protein [Bacteroidota bacterium]
MPLSDEILRTDAWEGIDILYGSNADGITYTFIVEPGVDVANLEFTFQGQNNLSTNANGELVISTDLGDIIWPLPIATQYDAQSNEYPSSLAPSYIITGDKVKINAMNASNDRYLVLRIKKNAGSASGGAGTNWITYFGTDNGYGNVLEYELFSSLGLNENNDLFLGGLTLNTFLPEDIGLVTIYGSSIPDMNDSNALLVKFDNGDAFQFGTIWGGSREDRCKDIAVYNDNVFVVGNSNSPSFPVTNGNSNTNFLDGFIGSFKVGDGTRTRLELFSGNANDDLTTIDVSSTGRLFVAGSTFSTDIMPVTQNGADNQSSDNVRKELIVLEMDQEFKILWSTFFGHYIPSNNPIDYINDVTIKPNETGFYITGTAADVGYNQSDNVPPTSNGIFSFPKYSQSNDDTQLSVNNGAGSGPADAFIAEFGSNNQLLWTTFVGGSSADFLHSDVHSTLAINLNENNEITIVGKTFDFSSFPSSTIGYQETALSNTLRKDFIATFKNRQLSWTSSFGGVSSPMSSIPSRSTVNYDNNGNIIITGGTDLLPITLTNNCSPTESAGFFPYCPTTSLSEFTQSTLADADFSPFYLDTYIAIFSPNKNLRYSSYLGGNRLDVVNVAAFSGDLYLGGLTTSDLDLPVDFPSGAYMQNALMGEGDGLIARLTFNTSIAVGTRELISERSLKMFPNPTQDRVIIELPQEYSTTNLKEIPIQVFNTIGQEVNFSIMYNSHSNDGKIEIDLGNAPTGAYICKLGNFQGRVVKIQ